jgi:hypothetical protein
MSYSIVKADCLDFLRAQPDDSVDLVFGSPPYELARLYLEGGVNLGVTRKTEAWVAWMMEIYTECRRVCTGLVAFVVEGQTRDRRYSSGPLLLAADLHRAGFNLRKPPIFHRVGVPGSGGAGDDHETGGPDWLRNDYEFIICTTRGGKLPWADGTACGHTPKWAPGGEMSNRAVNGTRANQGRNQWGSNHASGGTDKNGVKKNKGMRPSHRTKKMYARNQDGSRDADEHYSPPVLANPGNVIHCLVGGGVMGSPMAHDNEAPFPEKLAEFFVLSFCKPDGIVCDPFSGSGTTAAVSVRHGRNFTGCDLRQSQVDLGLKRLAQETPLALFTD